MGIKSKGTNLNLKKISAFLALFITISTVIGILFQLDNRWAKADDVEKIRIETKSNIRQLEKRLDLKILEDRLFAIQERIWKLNDRYGEKLDDMPEEVKDIYRDLKNIKEKLEKKIELLSKPVTFTPPKEISYEEYLKIINNKG